MHEVARSQRILAHTHKQTSSGFSIKSGENVSYIRVAPKPPQTISRREQENLLELAKIVCKLANAGQVAPAGPDPYQWRKAAYRLLVTSGWAPFEGYFEDERLYFAASAPGGPEVSQTRSLMAEMNISSPGIAFALRQALVECQRLAQSLADFIKPDHNFPISAWLRVPNGPIFQASRETGKIEEGDFEPPLGPLQDALLRFLRHRKADYRRLGRCTNEKCGAFFYKPRLSSTACSRKCVDLLQSRAYYAREREHRERALALRQEGKNLTAIARAMNLKLHHIHRYLDSKE
jgi:hypothetical protein